jgi:hypothetical protein
MIMATSGDKNYYKLLKRFESNIFKMFGQYPIIYDMGLTGSQKKSLKSEIRRMDTDFDFSGLSDEGFINATHKPLCILDALKKSDTSCLFMDADILFTRKVEKGDFDLDSFDIAVTPRHEDERYELLFANGLINSGTLFFNNNAKVYGFIESWILECSKGNMSDQLCLSNLLSKDKNEMFTKDQLRLDGINVKLLDASKYNDVSLSTGLILHYKGAARSIMTKMRYTTDYYLLKYDVRLRSITSVFFRYLIKMNQIFNKN